MYKRRKQRPIRRQIILLIVGLAITLWFSFSLRNIETNNNSLVSILTSTTSPSATPQITLNFCQNIEKVTTPKGAPLPLKNFCQVPVSLIRKGERLHKKRFPWAPLLIFWTKKGRQIPLEGLNHQGKKLYLWKRVPFHSPHLDQILSDELTLL